MNKILSLHENTRSIKQDNAKIVKGYVKVYVQGTDILLFEGPNKVLVAGSAFTAGKHFNILPSIKTPSYNTQLGLDNIVSLTATEEKASLVYLFGVGTSGCGPENSQVYDVDYTKWIKPEDLVPFRYQIADNDLSDLMRQKYFGRKNLPELDRIAYYFKAFETSPVISQQYLDGTPIDENVYISDNSMEAETYVELKLSITKEDCRDYFIATTGINEARVNTISLLTAFPKEINGDTYYQGIRPLTQLNFPNESLIDLTKGVDIIYDIYY